MKGLFKGILVIMMLLVAGLLGLESYRSVSSEKAAPAPVTNHRSVSSPFYNTSDARAPYAFPLKKAPHKAR